MTTIKDLTTSACNEEDDLFFFETDHLALKGNVDYSELLKTLVILQSQNIQAIKDYDEIAQVYKNALDDPGAFVERLKSGEKMCPDMLHIVDVPSVNWDKYKIKPHSQLLQQLNTSNQDEHYLNADTLKQKEANTYNKAWTVDEQKRLEELLIQFPPEPIELHRLKKIATALGTRTLAQVTSRVQKYFLKLARMGLPVPGRMPKALNDKMKKCHPHQRFNHLLLRPSTFFPELDIPVKMDDTDVAPGPSSDRSNVSYDMTDKPTNYLLPSAAYLEQSFNAQSDNVAKVNEAEIRIELLKQIRAVKALEEIIEERNLDRHSDYTCDYCNEEPIIGTRWHCYTCDTSASIDYCTDCMISQIFSSEPHNIIHKFITIGMPTKKEPSPEHTTQIQSDSKMSSGSESDEGYEFDTTEHKYDSYPTTTDIDSYNLEDNDENDSDSESSQDCQTEQQLENLQNYDSENENDEELIENEDFDFSKIIKQEFVD